MTNMNKKGADIAIGTIVLIILALVVLVVVIYGFTIGWGNLFQNLIGYGGGQVNVQTVVNSCQVVCSTQSTYDYCSKKRNVVFEEKGKGELLTCDQLAKRTPSVGLSCDNIDCGVGISGKGICNGELNPAVCESKNNLGRANCESLSVCKWIDDNNPNDNIGSCALKQGSNCASFNDNQVACNDLQGFGCNWQAV